MFWAGVLKGIRASHVTSLAEWPSLLQLMHLIRQLQVPGLAWLATIPTICPPLADHMPIITILNLSLPHSTAPIALDYRAADWPAISTALTARLEAESPTIHIKSKEEFTEKANIVV